MRVPCRGRFESHSLQPESNAIDGIGGSTEAEKSFGFFEQPRVRRALGLLAVGHFLPGDGNGCKMLRERSCGSIHDLSGCVSHVPLVSDPMMDADQFHGFYRTDRFLILRRGDLQAYSERSRVVSHELHPGRAAVIELAYVSRASISLESVEFVGELLSLACEVRGRVRRALEIGFKCSAKLLDRISMALRMRAQKVFDDALDGSIPKTGGCDESIAFLVWN